MVAVGQRGDAGGGHLLLDVVLHLPGRGNARQQEHVAAFCRCRRGSLLREERLQRLVVERCEVELLIGVEVHLLRQHTVFHRLEILRTLRDDDDVGPVLGLQRLAEPSGRQQFIEDDQTMVVDEQDVDAGLHVAVLEGIIENDDVRTVFKIRQTVYAPSTLLVHGDVDFRELPLDLVRLVAKVSHCGVGRGQQIAVALALVAPAQHGNLHLVLQQPDEILHVGRLARAAHGDVAHGDDRGAIGPAFQDVRLEEEIPEADSQSVQPTEWQQTLVDLYEVLSPQLSILNLFHPDVLEHTSLDAVVALDVAAELEQRLIQVAQHLAEFTVEIGALLLVRQQLIHPTALVRGIGGGIVLADLGQFGGLLHGIVQTAEFIHEFNLQGVRSQPYAALADGVHLVRLHPATLRHDVEEGLIAAIHVALHILHLLAVVLGEDQVLLIVGEFVGLHAVEVDAEFVSHQFAEVRDEAEDADAARDGGRLGKDIVGGRTDPVAA